MVRIDLFFKKVLIFKKRSEAKIMCNKNLIKLNGRYAKASKTVNPGDLIEIETVKGIRKIKVLQIPQGNIGKDETELYYEEY
ncbi:MAG: RNA-binding protein [Candidatus Stahlbacteria bacterium]|nr:MAG: RNA-binding protein [Candidatus Stahlbacteria bacterium]